MQERISSIVDVDAIKEEFKQLNEFIEKEKQLLRSLRAPVIILTERKALLYITGIFLVGLAIGLLW